MSETFKLSNDLFTRIECLKKWQIEQQQKLIEQQSQQKEFLSQEHKRLYEALGVKNNTSNDMLKEMLMSPKRNEENHQSEPYEDSIKSGNVSYNQSIDDIPIRSPNKDFNVMLEEKLREEDHSDTNQNIVAKRPYLKKGEGLRRFRMSLDDVGQKKPCTPSYQSKFSNKTVKQTTKPTQHKETNNKPKKLQKVAKKSPTKQTPLKQKVIPKIHNSSPEPQKNLTSNENYASVSSFFETDCSSVNSTPSKKSKVNIHRKQQQPKVLWKKGSPSSYEQLIAELKQVRQENPEVFKETPKKTENEVLDELKMFEVLELKASNSSFCSTNSSLAQFLEQPIKSTPQKVIDLSSLQSKDSPLKQEKNQAKSKTVSFMDVISNQASDDLNEEDNVNSEYYDIDSSVDYCSSSINSDDLIDSHYFQEDIAEKQPIKKPAPILKDAATNTDEVLINSDLLKTRLQQLEKEIATFRAENAQVYKLKAQYETDFKNLDKRKRQQDKQIEELKQKMKRELENEKSKISKDRIVYDRYAREIRENKTLRKKDRDEINLLRSKLSNIQEEIKLKESKWGATQARLRTQLRHFEKETDILQKENDDLRTKNGKLEEMNKLLTTRIPTRTKILHEFNKNLSKFTKEAKKKVETETRRSMSAVALKTTKNTKTRSKSLDNRKYKRPVKISESDKENNFNSSNDSDTSTNSSRESHFASLERNYEKMFGTSSKNKETEMPLAEQSSYSDSTARKEELILEDGTRQITYPNGNIRTISADEQTIIVKFHNGDIKETYKHTGIIKYLYTESNTWHTTFPDGLELLEFGNGQVEKRFLNGRCEVYFPNGCRRCTSPGGTEDVSYPDGTTVITKPSTDERILTLPNGQKEIHTSEHKRREYPDGTIKILYPDGIQETRYANGRIRLKDKLGNLIMDSAIAQ